jgi:hypothetical protein
MQQTESLLLPDARTINVVRHDKFIGGTKAIVLPQILSNMANGKPVHFTYATPSWGYAQHALAVSCKRIGCTAHVFFPKRKEPSLPSQLAEQAGAIMHPIKPGYLSTVQARQRQWQEANPDSIALPFGFAMPELSEALTSFAKTIKPQPTPSARIWLAAGSGTLWQSLAKAWPNNRFGVVQVGREVKHKPQAGDLLFKAPESFERIAKVPPPFESAANYDAKVWQFVLQHAASGDYFWNVAG